MLVGVQHAFLLAEADDNFTFRWRNKPEYINVEKFFEEEQLERVEKLSNLTGRPIQDLVREAIAQYEPEGDR